MYYDQTSWAHDPRKPKRHRMMLEGNMSAAENWDMFFQNGEHGSDGYQPCFTPNQNNPSNYLLIT